MQLDDGTPTGIAEDELLYPWHPWAGCLVDIHEVVEKAGTEVFRCNLSGRASARWLEIPDWMFERLRSFMTFTLPARRSANG
jgi:hypothetical protein